MADEENKGGEHFAERRQPTVMVLEPEQARMLKEMYTTVIELKVVVTHPEMGIVPLLKKHNKILYGNGWPGLKVQTAAIWALVAVLGTDHPVVQKLVKMWWK